MIGNNNISRRIGAAFAFRVTFRFCHFVQCGLRPSSSEIAPNYIRYVDFDEYNTLVFRRFA